MTKVQKEYLVLGLGTLLTIVVFFGIGAGSLCSITGFVYPSYKSFQAIESKMKGDDQQWLIYWVMYAGFSVIESFSDFLLYWIPFYYAFKLAFLLWMMLPQTQGARYVVKLHCLLVQIHFLILPLFRLDSCTNRS